MSTAKNIIENLENQIGVPNAFGSKDLASQELYDAIEHEDIDWDNERMMELEADHADELAPAEDNDPIQD